MAFDIKLRVWGDYACFTRPEMKVERVSYDVMTPSAARGILEAIHWKPAIRWVIDRIHVLRPIKFDNIRRNEVSSKIPKPNPVTAMRDKKTLYFLVDDGGNRQHWLKIVPVRADTGMVALGAMVTVKANGLTMLQPALGVNGYLTSGDPRPHFGLGQAGQAESVEIRWPDGKKHVLAGVKADQILKVKSGE